MRKTKIEIIEETVDFYCEDPSRRASVNDICVYLDPSSGNKCAVGRCFDTKHKEYADLSRSGEAADDIDLEDVLLDEYKGHDKNFWRNLQTLHDPNSNWTPNGLSDDGMTDLAIPKKTYRNN